MSRLATADDRGLISGLQERAAQAFPALVSDHLDGWWLRHADSAAWWASAVLPHGDSGRLALATKIRCVEEFYATQGAPARFQISPAACPANLDAAMADLGYHRESPMSLHVASTTHVIDRLPTAGRRIRIDEQLTESWFKTWLVVHGSGRDPDSDWDKLCRVERASAYASLLTEAGVSAVGRAVTETGWTGVFGMATLPGARAGGAATAVLAALARWADDHGCGHMYLQVECANAPARRLYDRAGFTELCRYHYRRGGPIS